MTRSDFQLLALERLRDADVLFANGRFGAAYYLAGYAVECALKACIAKATKEFDFPDKLLVNQSHTHDLKRLVELSQLNDVFKSESKANSAFRRSWRTVQAWSEDSRYVPSQQAEADAMLKAVKDPWIGVLPCIRKHW